MIKIWHNNRCSKSREAKAILDESNHKFEVFEYLKNDFSSSDLKELISKLGISDIRQMLRTKEVEYKELNLSDESLSQDEIIDLVVQNPKLVERPIIIKDGKAVIARPMENLVNLLEG